MYSEGPFQSCGWMMMTVITSFIFMFRNNAVSSSPIYKCEEDAILIEFEQNWAHQFWKVPLCVYLNVLFTPSLPRNYRLFRAIAGVWRSVSLIVQRIISVQLSSVTQLCLTLCDPMNHSTPGLPVHHQLPEFTQTHVHWVGDAIQPSHPLLSPSPPAPNPFQHQSLFQWVSSSHEVAKVLEFQL